MALSTVHFELQLLRGERWVIDTVLRERDEIMALARGIAERGDADGVRVVKECASDAEGSVSAMILFEAVRPRPKPQRRRPAPVPQPAAGPMPEMPAAERQLEVEPRRPAPPAPWWRSAAGLSGLGAGLCVVLLAVLSLLV